MTNFFKGTFQDKNGKKVTKEFTSNTKSSSELRKEALDKYKEKGYKYTSGSMGSRG